jgi:hypothetical protein
MLTTALLALALTTEASATEIGNGRNLGLGIQLGSPTGLTGKYYLGGRRNAVSFALGSQYDGGFYSGVWVTGSYDFHIEELVNEPEFALPLRVGIGGFLATGSYRFGYYRDDLFLGLRTPIGLDFDLTGAPVQIYIEVAFDLVLYPGIYGGLDAGLGVRYYF